jgi:hypothetical protein
MIGVNTHKIKIIVSHLSLCLNRGVRIGINKGIVKPMK